MSKDKKTTSTPASTPAAAPQKKAEPVKKAEPAPKKAEAESSSSSAKKTETAPKKTESPKESAPQKKVESSKDSAKKSSTAPEAKKSSTKTDKAPAATTADAGKKKKDATSTPATGKATGKTTGKTTTTTATPAATEVKGKKASAKASNIKKVAQQGISKRSRKIRTSVTFHRPKVLHLARDPKYQRKSVPSQKGLDKFSIIKHPLTTETAVKKIEDHKTLVFITDLRANKHQIRDAVQRLYDVKVVNVNTLIRPDGQKKAYVRLSAEQDALEIASKIGIF